MCSVRAELQLTRSKDYWLNLHTHIQKVVMAYIVREVVPEEYIATDSRQIENIQTYTT